MKEKNEKKIVFVCTGNTCRSPMAEAIFNILAQETNIKAVSCGLQSFFPLPASKGAQNAVKKYGADLSEHKSRPITGDLIKDALGIYCMTSAHAQRVASQFPEVSHLVSTLDSRDISDPFGGSDEVYEKTAEQIFTCLKNLIDNKLRGL